MRFPGLTVLPITCGAFGNHSCPGPAPTGSHCINGRRDPRRGSVHTPLELTPTVLWEAGGDRAAGRGVGEARPGLGVSGKANQPEKMVGDRRWPCEGRGQKEPRNRNAKSGFRDRCATLCEASGGPQPKRGARLRQEESRPMLQPLRSLSPRVPEPSPAQQALDSSKEGSHMEFQFWNDPSGSWAKTGLPVCSSRWVHRGRGGPC